MTPPQVLEAIVFYQRLEATGFYDTGRHRQGPATAVCRQPGYQTLESGPASCLNWPLHMMQTPEQLEDDILYQRLKATDFSDTERHRQDSANAVYRHPEYQTFESRLASFRNWPPHIIQTPQQLAKAGFYHTGHGDGVRCFACDGGLQHWEPEDDPWIEHCRWFTACPFARIQKGDRFIELVQTYKNQLEAFTENGMSLRLEALKLRDPELQDAMDGRKAVCKKMGYLTKEINEAIKELREKGTRNPSIEEIIDVMEVIKRRKMLQAVANETPAEENQRQNKTNCHRECMECGEPLSRCKVCGEVNRKKIQIIKIEWI
ncbi:baculoviral IAP repeat-containing protein 7-like isoform X2 [Ruditapes philippinarum]|nr:baculoviral IAP repeat-containing protein 7-like isoform X2 [Ruditapes philippinarum]